MKHCAASLLFAAAAALAAQDGSNVVFRSDVSLVRVDTQVVDHNNRAITGLTAADFVLRDEGQPREIRNFTSEDMPADVLLLLDVSASMRPHVQRIASAAGQALRVLNDQDRVAIMVFDRDTRLRLPFRESRADVEREFRSLLRQEDFDGGTDITRGLLDAAEYAAREGRENARRAIVIMTDDETERDRDEAAVSRALTRANAVLFALIAPDALGSRSSAQWDGIIFGRRGGYGRGSRSATRSRTHSAGTPEIARDSGGDTVALDEAQSFEAMLARIRQRYSLNFYVPPEAQASQERRVEVQLADTARKRHPDAEVRYRKTYITPATLGASSASRDTTQSGGWRKIK